jgi:dihydrofolate synthase/folylpolyglutamate synthase
MNLVAWLDELENRNNIKLGFDRVADIALDLDICKFSKPVVMVAGTNGKGSTVAAITALALANGMRTAAYTSPHLLKFNERLCFNGNPVSDQVLCAAFAELQKHAKANLLTYFEFITLACFLAIKERQDELDIIILEIGLGGRFDIVNIVSPDVCVLTSVGIDHTSFLGETREEIGYQKVGIMRPGIPFVCAEVDVPNSVAQELRKTHAYYLGNDFFVDTNSANEISWRYQNDSCAIGEVNLKPSNLAAALMVAKLLNFYDPEKAAVLANLRLTGRMTWVKENVLVDVAHNPESISLLVGKIKDMKIKGRIIFVCSMLADKDLAQCFKMLSLVGNECYIAELKSYRKAELASLLAAANGKFKELRTFDTVAAAFATANNNLSTDDILIVCGSFYTVSEVLSYINNCSQNLEVI